MLLSKERMCVNPLQIHSALHTVMRYSISGISAPESSELKLLIKIYFSIDYI